jgi:hypothetical protein
VKISPHYRFHCSVSVLRNSNNMKWLVFATLLLYSADANLSPSLRIESESLRESRSLSNNVQADTERYTDGKDVAAQWLQSDDASPVTIYGTKYSDSLCTNEIGSIVWDYNTCHCIGGFCYSPASCAGSSMTVYEYFDGTGCNGVSSLFTFYADSCSFLSQGVNAILTCTGPGGSSATPYPSAAYPSVSSLPNFDVPTTGASLGVIVGATVGGLGFIAVVGVVMMRRYARWGAAYSGWYATGWYVRWRPVVLTVQLVDSRDDSENNPSFRASSEPTHPGPSG